MCSDDKLFNFPLIVAVYEKTAVGHVKSNWLLKTTESHCPKALQQCIYIVPAVPVAHYNTILI